MNPNTNQFEQVSYDDDTPSGNRAERRRAVAEERKHAKRYKKALRQNGTPVPDDWPIYDIGEHVMLKGYCFRIAGIGTNSMLLEPVGRP
jgi:hypothetical protein